MSEPKSIYIFGYSGHAYVVIETALALGITIKGYFDKQEANTNPYQIPYKGFEKEVNVAEIVGNDRVFPTVGENVLRHRLVQYFDEKGLKQMTVIDPSALVSSSATIGKSTYVGKGSIINAQAQIGAGVIVNTGAVVEHECYIADAAHIAPNATLCGNVTVGSQSFIGAGSVIRPNLTIGDNVILGAGSVLVKDIGKSGMWYGNPAMCKS